MALTLLQMATFVCSKVTQFDPVSFGICKTFLDARYRMVWDVMDWSDAQITKTLTVLPSNIGSGVPTEFVYPSGIERIISIRAGKDHFLDPVTQDFLYQTDPTIFQRNGTPIYWDENTNPSNGVITVTIYPSINQPTDILIFGKQACPGLPQEASTSLLRNCDNAIMAFATGDMLERARQYAKAQQKFQEAAALLQEAQNVENQQANQPRKSKNLTVAGNSLSEMTDAVSAICDAWTPESTILIREFIRRRYQDLYDMMLWPDSAIAVQVPGGLEEIILPDYVDRVKGVRSAAAFRLDPVEDTVFLNLDPSIFDQTGESMSYSFLTPCGVAIRPPGTEGLSFVSTSALDIGKKVFISGESRGNIVTETLTLNGTFKIGTSNQWDLPITLAKDITVGDISVNGITTGLQYEFLESYEREKKHVRLWIHPQPNPPIGVSTGPANPDTLILAKRKVKPLLTDQDTPILTGCQSALINGAASDFLSKAGQGEQAKRCQDKATAAVQNLISLNTTQAAYAPRFIPEVEPSGLGIDSLCSWL